MTLASLRAGLRSTALALLIALPAAAEERNPTGWALFGPCRGNCSVAVYAGPAVEDSMADVLLKSPELPFSWDFRSDDRLAGLAFARYAATLWGRVDIEPEVGVARRFGRQDETEVWAAVYGRWRGFPWDGTVLTTIAVSTGFNFASRVSEVEDARAGPDVDGSQLMHYFSPEITLALPSRPDVELMFRFHHRSGVFGLVSEARGGAHYGTVGLRVRF